MIALDHVNSSRNPFPEIEAAARQARRDQQLMKRLRQSAVYRNYKNAFEKSIGLPLTLHGPRAFGLVHANSRRENPFCSLMGACGKSCSGCLMLQGRLREQAVLEAKTLTCFAGLSESAVPVRIGDRVVAYLHVGQMLLRQPSQAQFKRTTQQLLDWGVTVDLERVREAYFSTRMISPDDYEAILRMLTIFAHQLATLSNQLAIVTECPDPPVIERAKRFIAEHLDEEITLGRIAHAANASMFYFCKLFRRVTGLNLLDYVARARVERVKVFLLNPHTRINEAAYAAGFQSLSQFNRVFKRVVGEQPRTWRAQLGN